MKNKLMAVLLTAVMSISLVACQGSEETESGGTGTDLAELTFVLDWTPNTNHTGLYVALEKGYFVEEGLEVNIVQPPEGGATDMVASGGASFGIDFQDTMAAALASDSPLPITAVAAILQHNTSGIVSLEEKGITSPAKMEGHVYATWDSPIEQAMIKNVVEEDGGVYENIELVSTYVEDVQQGLNMDVDTVWIYEGWDGIRLEEAEVATNYFSFREINEVFDYYSPVIIANDTYLEENSEQAKSFLRAVKKGYEYAAEYPEESAEILCEQVPELDLDFVKASQAYLSTQYIADASEWGVIDPTRWDAFYEWLTTNELVENPLEAGIGFSVEYLK